MGTFLNRDHFEARLELSRATLAEMLKAIGRRALAIAGELQDVAEWFRNECRRIVRDTTGRLEFPHKPGPVDVEAFLEADGFDSQTENAHGRPVDSQGAACQ
jgi:hypothetical protein